MDSVISSSPPLLAHAGDQWTDSYGRQFVYTMNADGTHGQWVQVPLQRSGPPAPTVTDAPVVINPTPKITSSHLPPLAPNPNDLWFDTLTGFLFIWYWDGNTYQWVVTNPGRGSDVPPPPAAIPVLLTPNPGVLLTPSPITSVGGIGVDTVWFDARVASEIPAHLPPSGAAGGDLAGTYPNPTVKTNVNLSGAPTTTTPATADNSTKIPTTAFVKANIAALPAPPTTLPPSGTAGGDLSGTYPNPSLNPEVIDDRVAALLVAGTNITLSYNDPANTLTINSTASGGGGSASLTISDTPPGSPTAGMMWWNSVLGTLMIYYQDANSSQWVPATPTVSGAGTFLPLSGGTLTGPLIGTTAAFTSTTPGAKVLTVTGTTTSAAQDYFDVKLLDATGGGGSALRVLGGATGINPLFQVDRAGDTQFSGWLRALSTSGLVTNGADYFALTLGNGAGGNLGLFAGLSNPTFSTFGSYGSLYMNGSSPGLPYYNNNGTTGWDRLVGETATQTLTGKTIRAGYATGVPITTSGTVVTPAVQVASTAIDGYSALRYGGGNGATFTFAKSGSTTLGTQALVSSGTSAGKISFNGSNGTSFIEAAYIEGAIDSAGTPGVASMPGRVSIAVSPDGSATPAEALRIDSFKSVFLYGQLNGTAANFTANVAGSPTVLAIGNSNTGSTAQSIFQQSVGARFVNRTIDYTGQYLIENASGLPTRYSDFDTHNFRTTAGAGYAVLNSAGLTLTGGVSAAGTVMAPGAQIQMVSVETGAVATGTGLIPHDDTIPQITEGDEYMTCSITPKSATSKLIIEGIANLASTGNVVLVCALFRDSVANALAAVRQDTPYAVSSLCMSFRHVMTSGTTSPIIFRVRAGGNGGAYTTTFNGTAGARIFGGVMASSIVIREVAP